MIPTSTITKRKKTWGTPEYVDDIQTTSAESASEPVGQKSTLSNASVREEPSPQNTPAPTRTRTLNFTHPPNRENSQLRKATAGEVARPQSLRSSKFDAKWDGVPGDNAKGQGNALKAIQARFTAAKSSRVWDTYVRKAEEEDKDLAEDWDRIIDVTLVFAALFSAISTGFVLESSKNLQPDQAKATVLAIQGLTTAIQAGTNGSMTQTTAWDKSLFEPTFLTIWVNCLWFLSLGLSISVLLLAMLAKRWCYTFRSKRSGTSHERAIKRQKLWDAIEKWKIKLVIEQLPTLMHIAVLFLFFGLVVYLAEIHQTTMIVTAVLVGFTTVLYIALTVLPIWYQNCPMVTPFTRIMLAIHWYLLRGSKFIAIQARLHLEIISTPLTYDFYGRVWGSGWEFLDSMVSDPNQYFCVAWMNLISLWDQLIQRIAVTVEPRKDQDECHKNVDWAMHGCTGHAIIKTSPQPRPDESNRHAFNALAWILNHSTDREIIKEVLDHITRFPDVILNSFANSEQLYMIASTAAEHLNRFQHDPAEWRHTLHISSSCTRLMYLTIWPWLHKSVDYEVIYPKIQNLLDRCRHFADTEMTPNEVGKQIVVIENEVTKLPEPISWLEDLAGKMALGCSPKSGLKMCTALGRTMLKEEAGLHSRHLDVELYPTLWWIFLNSVMSCTYGSWASRQYKEQRKSIPPGSKSDSMLMLSHFRDSRKRQESGLWLAIVSLLQYGIDALKSAIASTLYTTHPLSDSLSALLHDLEEVKGLKDVLATNSDQELDYDHILETYVPKEGGNLPHMLLTAGILLKTWKDHPNRGSTHLLAQLLPDMLFGRNGANLSTASGSALSKGCVGMIPTTNQLIMASSKIAAWAWMPFSVPISSVELKGKYPNYSQHDMIWEPLEAVGLLRAPVNLPGTYRSVGPNLLAVSRTAENLGEKLPEEVYRATGYYLYIKASLLNRLYSLSTANAHSPNILPWSVALAKQVVALLPFWVPETLDPDEQDYIISSLMKLANTLLDAFEYSTSLEPLKSSQKSVTAPHNASVKPTDAPDQLEALIQARIISTLAVPFSRGFQPLTDRTNKFIPDQAEWHNDLARTIERLARTGPKLCLQKDFAKPTNDTSHQGESWERARLQDYATSSSNGSEDHGAVHNNDNRASCYSDMVAYYEA